MTNWLSTNKPFDAVISNNDEMAIGAIQAMKAGGIDMKFTPDLKFLHDDSFNNAAYIDRLFDDPKVRADLEKPADGEDVS